MSEFWGRIRAIWQAAGQGIRRSAGAGLAVVFGRERVTNWGQSYDQFRADHSVWYRTGQGLLSFVGFVGLYVFIINYNFLWLTGEMPSVTDLSNPKLAQSSEIYSLDSVLIGKVYTENRTPIKFDDIPRHLIDALIATEDVRFYNHSGIDPRAIGGVLLSVVRRGDRGGGSTITQQLAKNLFKTRRKTSTGFLARIPGVRTLIYKSKEWLTAIKLENNFSKQEILTYYFNTVDFGSNSFGLKTAARTYFNKSPDSLSIQEGAVLVGLQKATTSYNPLKNPKRSQERRNVVLGQMAKYGYLTKTQADSVAALPLVTHFTPDNPYAGPASYLKNVVLDYVRKWGDENGYDLYTDGLKIYTTIDSRMQTYAEEAVREKMKPLQRTFDNHWRDRNPWTDENGDEIPNFIDTVAKRTDRYKALVRRFPTEPDSVNYYLKVQSHKMKLFDWKGEREQEMTTYDSIAYYKRFLQAGMVAMDPHTGHVRAWVGGLNYDFFKYDHVKQAKRQPGSTFKPFVYSAAIDDTLQNMAPCDRMRDKPYSTEYRENGEDKVWEPRNSTGSFTYSNMTLRRAMARSVNSITAQLTERVGPETVVRYAHKLGIQSPLEAVPSIGLGSSDVTLYEMVAAYSTFANEGTYTEPILIKRIDDRNGNQIESFEPKRRPAISPESAFLMIHMLKGGLQEPGGTSQNLWSYDLFKNRNEVGGKTGTTSNNSDGWFMGVSNQLVVGAWVGGDDRSIHFRSTDLGEGARTALPLVGRFLEKVYADRRFRSLQGPFPKPTVPINKEYLNCFDPEPAYEEETDSTATELPGDSSFIQTLPPTPVEPPDTTSGTRQ
ncbi:MAG: transglycosylase domain-containing protein [Bacteroidetes bacterium]|nr:transglycosylase domain-containing protein [Fibrella sp.]